MSILNVNKINPVGGGSTITITGIASVTGNIISSGTITGAHHGDGANLTSLPAANLTGSLPAISGANLTDIVTGVGTADSINTSGIITATHFSTSASTYDIDYLVVGGGGQGGDQHGGGGGAGGLKNSFRGEKSGGGLSAYMPIRTAKGVTYTITVGAGSGSSHPGTGQDGAGGSPSSIAGTGGFTTISVSGGGGGAGHHDGGAQAGNGGCGGGSGLTGSGGDGVLDEGFGGGDNPGSGYASFPQNGAGGGGAGGPGGNPAMNSRPTDNNYGAFGGEGVFSTITGTPTGYAGGGSGGSHAPHSPSSGTAHNGDPRAGHQINIGKRYGGADGAIGNGGGGANAPDNLGGGGGGSGGAGLACGGGGSGVVILRMATAMYSGTVTGSPTVTTDGPDTILKFTGSGTYVS